MEHHSKSNGDPNQWIRIKIIPRLSRIHLSRVVKIHGILGGCRVNKWPWLTDPQPPRTICPVLYHMLHTELVGALVECELARASQHTLKTPHVPSWYLASQIPTPTLSNKWELMYNI